MKDLKEFKMANGATWVRGKSDANEGYCWRLHNLSGSYVTQAIEVKRNNRGVQLETYLLNGGRTAFWLKPENGKFV